MSSLWAYAYQIVPAQQSRRLGGIRTLLNNETAAVLAGGGKWSGRLVLEREATHILIVCDNRERHSAINLKLEAELLRLDATFSVTAPMAVLDPDAVRDRPAVYAGNGR